MMRELWDMTLHCPEMWRLQTPDSRQRQLLGAFAKFRKATVTFVMSIRASVRPHLTTWLQLKRFSWNFIYKDFSKICRENSSFIKILQEPELYMKTDDHLWQYLAEFLFLWEMFQTNVVEKNHNTHFIFSSFFPENPSVYEVVWRSMVEPDRPRMII
jgi:hypothetical protein